MNTKPIKQLEVETYYTHGVGVTVKIDYVKGEISLLDQNNSPKHWIFAGRRIEYMAGWQNIFDAMKFAVEQAEKKLEKHQAEKARQLVQKEKDFVQILKSEGKKKK